MQLIKTGVLASALLATTDALTINRAHLRAHRAASRDAAVEAREPQDKVVVVHTTIVKYVKSFQKPTKKVQAQPAPAQPTPAAAVAAAPVEVQVQPAAQPPSSVKAEEPAKSPAPEPAKEPAKAAAAPAISGGKRGLAYAGEDTQFLDALSKGGKCSWSYNWGSRKPSSAPSGLEFVPMCWNKAKCGGSWQQDVKDAIAAGSKAVLSFNEPDREDQANLSPDQAARDHIAMFGDLVGKVKIGAPAVTSDTRTDKLMGLPYLKQFMSACNAQAGGNCPIDFCPVHFYGEANTEKDLYTHLKGAHQICGNKPIWITELGLFKGGLEQHAVFMKNVIKALESPEFAFVERYAYFMASQDKFNWSALVQGNAITDLGMKYASADF